MNRSSASVEVASSAEASSRQWHSAPAASHTRPRTRAHQSYILTVALEDYFHATPFRPWIREETWYRFEDRLAGSTRRALDLLDRCEARATFFVDSHTARSAPQLVREVAERGHEIACRGEHRGPPRELGPERFREQAVRCRDQLEALIGRPVLGFRLGSDCLTPQDLWVLDVLAECGFLYDSSIGPAVGTNAAKVLRSYHRHRAQLSHRLFQEVPVSALAVFGLEVPVAGSLRHFPTTWMKNAIEHWHRHHTDPYVMSFRTWELDPDQPRINAGPIAARIWHYRNLDQMPLLLEKVLSSYRFTTIAAHLALELSGWRAATDGAAGRANHVSPPSEAELMAGETGPKAPTSTLPVSIVVPCYNESQSLGYLSNTLNSVMRALGDDYTLTFIFVDDGSTDDTWSVLHKLFGSRPDCRLVKHAQNLGVAHSIQTGIRHAETQIVCSIDCDCTYDPHELGRMIPLLTDGVDIVTASPYHPKGQVRNVPSWRIFLSKTLSQLYRLVLHQKLYTYTSCFRVYRRQSAATLKIRHPGFLGVAELIAQADVSGHRIVEYPSTLEVRVLGRSKMKILLAITGHLSLLADLVRVRISRRKGSPSAEART
jgi:polysaccharide deacetylase family protein (PEP-CTERM system associated)